MTVSPPKPTHNFFPLRFSSPLAVSEDERHAMIATEAYLRSERRAFEPGHAAEDWAAAEAEIDARLAHGRRLSGFSA